jgi:MFS family permease
MSLPPATLQGRSYFGIPSSILRIQLSVLCAAIGMGMVYSVLTLNGKSLGANAWHVGLLLAAFGGVRCLANLPTGIASEYFGRRWTATGGLVAAAASSF